MNFKAVSFTVINIALCLATTARTDRALDLIDTRVGTDYAVTATAGLFGKGSEEHGLNLISF